MEQLTPVDDLRIVLDVTSIPLCIVNKSGLILYRNKAWSNFKPALEIIGGLIEDDGQSFGWLYQHDICYYSTLADDHPIKRVTFKYENCMYELLIEPLFGSSTESEYFLKIIFDVTAHKEKENLLKDIILRRRCDPDDAHAS
jgi:hypothetical protein